MALVGVRDIRDCLRQACHQESPTGSGTPFNIVRESLALPNFTQDEIGTLYGQHTAASGQVFDGEAVARSWHWSEGQPWLVNALANEAVAKILKNDYSSAVTAPIMEQAAENLISRRETHIDSLLERLKEPRVVKIMDSVFAGTKRKHLLSDDDRRYCLDLGLVVSDENDNLRPANGINREVMSRVITDEIQKLLFR
jgi:hypothetical protein